MEEKMTKKQRATLTAYPIAALLFFLLLITISLFVHYTDEKSKENVKDQERVQNDYQSIQVAENKQLQSFLAKESNVLTRATYQPVKKENFQELHLENVHSGIIFDVDSGTILWEKNPTEHRSVASITKLVTAMVVVDRMRNLNEIITIPASVAHIEGTKVGCPTSVICNGERLRAGEQVRLKDLLRSMLMFSANDAATVLAIHVAGSEEDFAKLMNARMKEIGAMNTHFCRPSGLELDGNEEMCYSSAYDIARVVAHLLNHEKYSVLWDMMSDKEATFTSVDGSVEHELKSTNRLLGEMPGLIGGKTGFTPRAGYCLVLATKDTSGEHKVVSIVLDDHYRFDDVQTMSTWAFDNYIWQ